MLFPLKLTSMKSMKKMQALQPQIAAINDKYKNIGLRDPRKAEQNQEVMELYKKHGVNPMGGCVPMVLQIPFFIAFYKVFSVSVEMRGANWLWVTDLSQPETLPIHILPIIMIASQFLMQKMTPASHGRRSQPAENDDVHAPDFRFHVLQLVERAGIILFDQQPGGHRAAIVLQSDVHRARWPRNRCSRPRKRSAGSRR